MLGLIDRYEGCEKNCAECVSGRPADAAATQESAALTLCRNAQLSTKLNVQPVLSALPVAYWVAGDTGLKQTTEAAWQGVTLTAEEIACIVPIPEAVVDDSSFDAWGELRPALAEAIAQVLDAAVFGGINKLASWPAAIEPAAITAGSTAEVGTSTPAQGGIVGDIGSAFDAVEAAGYQVSGVAAVAAMKGLLRKARDANGQRLVDPGSPTIEGRPALVPAPRHGRRDHTGDRRRLQPRRRRHPAGHHLQGPRSGRPLGRRGQGDLQPRAAGHGGYACGRPVRLRDRCPGDTEGRLRLPVRRLAGRRLEGRLPHACGQRRPALRPLAQAGAGRHDRPTSLPKPSLANGPLESRRQRNATEEWGR